MADILILTLTLTLCSCSYLSGRKTLLGGDAEKAGPKNEVVPKAEYDQLAQKYRELLEKVQTAEEHQASKMQFDPNKASQMVDELSKVSPGGELAETVDVFKKNESTPIDLRPTIAVSEGEMNSQIVLLKKAIEQVESNQLEKGLASLKLLENSTVDQISVRVKFYLAEILFKQNEFDLSLQMFEELVHDKAYSAYVIKALGRLIVCAEKLKLDKKKERYYSILHDFFEAV